jgi:glycine cleavage system H protein
MNIKQDYFYTKEHEWANLNGNIARVGITDYAQHKLGDITYVELPAIGKKVKQGEVLNGVESVKAASDVYSPLSGEVVKVNTALENDPGLINRSPYEDGWIAEIKISDENEIKNLMTANDYMKFLGE